MIRRCWHKFAALGLAIFGLLCLGATPALSAPRECIPVEIARRVADKSGLYSDFRVIRPDRWDDAMEIINHFVPPQFRREWPLVMLLNHKDTGGIMFVGGNNLLCLYVAFPPDEWFQIRMQLEGTPI